MREPSSVTQTARQRHPDELVGHFGARADTTHRTLKALSTALQKSDSTPASRAFDAWQRTFFAASAPKHSAGQNRKAQELFSIHTYYALVVKLIASVAARRFAGSSPSHVITTTEGEALRGAFADLERGDVFRECGIENFVDVDGDCFGWYTSAWNRSSGTGTGTCTEESAP